jgi:hypothetical protein
MMRDFKRVLLGLAWIILGLGGTAGLVRDQTTSIGPSDYDMKVRTQHGMYLAFYESTGKAVWFLRRQPVFWMNGSKTPEGLLRFVCTDGRTLSFQYDRYDPSKGEFYFAEGNKGTFSKARVTHEGLTSIFDMESYTEIRFILSLNLKLAQVDFHGNHVFTMEGQAGGGGVESMEWRSPLPKTGEGAATLLEPGKIVTAQPIKMETMTLALAGEYPAAFKPLKFNPAAQMLHFDDLDNNTIWAHVEFIEPPTGTPKIDSPVLVKMLTDQVVIRVRRGDQQQGNDAKVYFAASTPRKNDDFGIHWLTWPWRRVKQSDGNESLFFSTTKLTSPGFLVECGPLEKTQGFASIFLTKPQEWNPALGYQHPLYRIRLYPVTSWKDHYDNTILNMMIQRASHQYSLACDYEFLLDTGASSCQWILRGEVIAEFTATRQGSRNIWELGGSQLTEKAILDLDNKTFLLRSGGKLGSVEGYEKAADVVR